ncbi:MAG: molybdenum cofactor biosynthesis protein MoaA [Candidatus Syntrophoarchaeum caldarius]|uniref:Molybdenum cofactor biosynthesis protein MoaA n=1 Tax=Candidatus Syntropharchaeum caldarium TaxID=1838285 RepID=A0A1F2PAQ5_9EURY|nr:MAG: molybdenum cofactor biosynthesis protein MoaA [Candidatus Syntrophoarchaeum caldarius]
MVVKIVEVLKTTAGIDRVKFSGGEPLLRDDLPEILAALPALSDISLTTNGTLLEDVAPSLPACGLRINVSLDTLRAERYARITGAPGKMLARTLAGINRACELGFSPLKLNFVLLQGINDDEIWDVVEYIRKLNARWGKGSVILQLIELLDFNGIEELRGNMKAIESELALKCDSIRCRTMHHRRKYLIDEVEVEVVRPMDNSEFCANCNRLRVTSDGKFKPCLLRDDNLVAIEDLGNDAIMDAFMRSLALREPFFKG